MGSLRECQAALDLLEPTERVIELQNTANQLGGRIFNLCRSLDHQCEKFTTNKTNVASEALPPETCDL